MKRVRRHSRRFRFELPGVLAGVERVCGGCDLQVAIGQHGAVGLTRPGYGTAIVATHDWNFSLNTPGVSALRDFFASDQVRQIIGLSVMVPGKALFQADAEEIDRVFEEMQQFLVASIAVPRYIARKFPKDSEFVRRWELHHYQLGSGYPPDTPL